ncbi:CelD/BcsL family acetyltransferase involved in cellulose biosynthesis [Paucimonas lemoignei]|uniref:CelD/BcsL family acetyltransferase involved in cellulose biosynthesis n=1 Tax=Paucimonas lemoignei TaxID=29443 RepID=A0A4R3HSU3_PAULE|nr:GNAT family N-acetyltransferase [Paucimonas lemoignei]TCS34312.1 CelD/BcsL family acetyltransferase involved in cellulose biosynthesis [Paucimonas lemoignei]
MNLAIYTGKQAVSLAAADEFLSQWLALYEACPWATGFQHPDFVMPWFKLYGDRFLPVIVAGRDDNGTLTGLLTLGLHDGEHKLVGAGERQAEYHAWLERADSGSAFIRAAVGKLHGHFPGVDLCMKYLPADIPLDWAKSAESKRSLFCLRPYRRPVMRIEAENMERQRRKKNHRQNFNRLNRSGEVTFERVADHGHFQRVVEELWMQYDFRQGALHHYMPFSSDPAKRPFYLELHKRGMLHTSILNVGDQIAASHSGVVSKGSAVHLGINTHAPALAAHSPGNLLLAMLGVQLVEENMQALDLTPGGDGYKENFATEHDTVHELIVYGSLARRWRQEAAFAAKRKLKQRMQKAGWSTADAWAAIGKITKWRQLGLRGVVGSFFKQTNAADKTFRYYPERAPAAGAPFHIAKNNLRDLMAFDSNGASMTRWEFFRIAMERMERSVDVYSYVRGGKLAASCWVRQEQPATAQQEAAQKENKSAGAIVLFDLYVHKDCADSRFIQQFLAQVLSEVKDDQAARSIYFKGVPGKESGAALKECGFIDEAELAGSGLGPSAALSKDMQNISTGA